MKLTSAGQAIFEAVAKEWNDNQRSAVIRKGPASRKLISDGLIMAAENDTMLTLTDAGIALADEMGLLTSMHAEEVHKFTVTQEVAVDGHAFYATCSHGYTTGLHAEANDARDVALGHGAVSRPLFESARSSRGVQSVRFSWSDVTADYRESHPVIAEATPAPFRTGGKVKSTSRARRYRKGA